MNHPHLNYWSQKLLANPRRPRGHDRAFLEEVMRQSRIRADEPARPEGPSLLNVVPDQPVRRNRKQ